MDDELADLFAEEIYQWYMEHTSKDVWKPYNRLSESEKAKFEDITERLLAIIDTQDEFDDDFDDDDL